ncbi:xanthine dehydrogenase molybdopterin binding subunit [Lacrimispora defluvii]|uniref:Xanthine dehydrogenase molybdopterin binding subunit n=1 Tax=Lacrimispora defluvii TaxID=2719233 RepID=A0ABX1VZ24_9FIRM|nr:xanthine dehydrogenase molybdopterin binding subunit [Lacrimispora defluvii]NNJ31696.1 xanthine dehydrogenase molybdopterin binding subunit [Lacrimispora defluvii]
MRNEQMRQNDQWGQAGTSPLHVSGRDHVMGRSQFIDDIPKPGNLLYVKVMVSPVANGRIVKLDTQKASEMPGVAAVLTAEDIPGENQIGGIIKDEVCLAQGHVQFVGEPVAIIAAESIKEAEAAMEQILFEVEEETPVLTVREAIKRDQYVGPVRKIERGDVESVFADCPCYMEGVIRNEGQEHFYLETQSALAVPEDNGGLTLYSSSQNPNEIQKMASGVLGLPQNMITVDIKRLGGGFGGKESQATSWACLAALTAYHTGRPALIRLTRDEDMLSTGKRHAFESDYRVAFDKEGKILAYSVELNSNCGAVADVSTSVLERAMLHAENSYHIENIKIIGRPCKTNLHPATAFRGFGGPQGIFAIESVIERIAYTLGLDPYDVRMKNMYHKGDLAPYGQEIHHGEDIGRILEKLRTDSRWDERKKEIAAFNQKNRFAKKGLGITPVKFGISFTAAHLNQGSALIQVYTDGSVSVTHGAIEMGQEVNTKIAQIAATTLGVPIGTIRIESNNTKRVANTSATAASSGCDLNGHAVENAALKILGRLKELVSKLYPGEDGVFENGYVYGVHEGKTDYENSLISFKELVQKAYVERIDLCDHGYYATPGIYFDRDKGEGHPFLYYVFGAAVTEVTVDLLTGRTTLDSAHILHDCASSINPMVDIGQIQGAFIQGVGWVTTEELVYQDKGRLLSSSPATYKIPTIGDIPEEFHIELMEGCMNELGIKRSKAIGEPPFIYGESVFFAITNALSSLGSYPDELSIPATPEKIWRVVKRNKEQ